jgi:hypothetical protein
MFAVEKDPAKHIAASRSKASRLKAGGKYDIPYIKAGPNMGKVNRTILGKYRNVEGWAMPCKICRDEPDYAKSKLCDGYAMATANGFQNVSANIVCIGSTSRTRVVWRMASGRIGARKREYNTTISQLLRSDLGGDSSIFRGQDDGE